MIIYRVHYRHTGDYTDYATEDGAMVAARDYARKTGTGTVTKITEEKLRTFYFEAPLVQS